MVPVVSMTPFQDGRPIESERGMVVIDMVVTTTTATASC
jgi:hypothetical protein